MFDQLQHIWQKGTKPIRRVISLVTTSDPKTGQPVSLPLREQHTTLSPDGSVDTLQTVSFYKCGCSADRPTGGRCNVCGGVSCQQCGRFCNRCNAPLCPEHGLSLPTDSGSTISFCRECYDSVKRKQIARTIGRGLLSPFVSFDDGRKSSD